MSLSKKEKGVVDLIKAYQTGFISAESSMRELARIYEVNEKIDDTDTSWHDKMYVLED